MNVNLCRIDVLGYLNSEYELNCRLFQILLVSFTVLMCLSANVVRSML